MEGRKFKIRQNYEYLKLNIYSIFNKINQFLEGRKELN
jgi:hypothetical protein